MTFNFSEFFSQHQKNSSKYLCRSKIIQILCVFLSSNADYFFFVCLNVLFRVS